MFVGIRPNEFIDRHKHLWTYFLYTFQITNVRASSGFILRLSCVGQQLDADANSQMLTEWQGLFLDVFLLGDKI